ncbi:uncharacterized protein LOC142574697 [Dermacentor variabilis]|uniref:uncharacterized protein LOC142574697 n=1 Tax=Dermacentor variabilis TaxID=34621 RepID=UPI003F5C7810
MNPEPSLQSSATEEFRTPRGESNRISQTKDGGDGRRYIASLLFVCLIGVVAGVLTAGLVSVLTVLLNSPVSFTSAVINESAANPPACTTKDCSVLAQWLRVKLDHNVDPCHDFYEFVCDDYKGEHIISKASDKGRTLNSSCYRMMAATWRLIKRKEKNISQISEYSAPRK